MNKPLITKQGQLNYIKLVLLAIVFSLSTAFFVKVIESSSAFIYQYLPVFTILATILAIVHLLLMGFNELRQIERFIKEFITIRPVNNPYAEVNKIMLFKIEDIYIRIKAKISQEKLCVFRC